MHDELLRSYRAELDAVRQAHGGVRKLPDVRFFLFGMGRRRKLIYKAGVLSDGLSGEVVRQWSVAVDTILPPAYTVSITTSEGETVRIVEDEQGISIEENGQRSYLSDEPVQLPSFAGHPYASVLRVLLQEVLVNIVDGLPLPCYFVYGKPWYRDAALMAMVLVATGNLSLIREWILGLREPFDRNNAGETEADNLGQALYLISLASDTAHPLVASVLGTLSRFEEGQGIKGRSDFADHPVYQTKWAKYGLRALGLPDPYAIPHVRDTYSALFWWDYRDQHVDSPRFNSPDYPYLDWAWDHFSGTRGGLIGDHDYPLSWEAKASQADYDGMRVLSPVYTEQKLCVPHTWHAAEMFLYLLEAGDDKEWPDVCPDGTVCG